MLQARSQKYRISSKAHFDLTKLFSTSLKQLSLVYSRSQGWVEIWSCRNTEMLNPCRSCCHPDHFNYIITWMSNWVTGIDSRCNDTDKAPTWPGRDELIRLWLLSFWFVSWGMGESWIMIWICWFLTDILQLWKTWKAYCGGQIWFVIRIL